MKKSNLWKLLLSLGMFGMFVDGADAGGNNGEADAGDGIEADGTVLSEPKFGEEGYKYAGKYSSAQDLEKGYTEAQSHFNAKLTEANERFGKFQGAPEGDYELPEDTGFSDGVMDELKTWGKESGLSQEGFVDVLSKIQGRIKSDNDAFVTAEFEKLGKDGKARLDNINDKWAAQFGTASREMLSGKIITASDAEFYEAVLSKLTQQSASPDGGQSVNGSTITNEMLDAAMFKTDSQGNLKTMSDPEYKKHVEDLTAQYNKQRNR